MAMYLKATIWGLDREGVKAINTLDVMSPKPYGNAYGGFILGVTL